MFTLDLPQEIEKRLLILSMHTGRTIQFCAREAILDYIDEVEERYLAIDRAESRSQAYAQAHAKESSCEDYSSCADDSGA